MAVVTKAEPTPGPTHTAATGSARPLVVLLVVGAAVRLLLWWWFDGLRPRIDDEQDYRTLAANLVTRGEFALDYADDLGQVVPGRPTSLRPPLYPAFVAGIYALFGVDNFQAVRLAQAILSLVTVVVVYRMGLEIASRRAALLLAGFVCFYPSLLGYNNLLLTEVLFTFFVCASSYALVVGLRHDSYKALVAAGVLLGLGALTRSVLWLFFPVLCVFLLFAWHGGFGRRVLAVAAAAIPFALVLTPWAVRNTLLEKTVLVVDSMGGRNFMMGNYQHTPLYRSWETIELKGEKAWIYEVNQVREPGEEATQGQIDKLAMRQGLRFAAAHPGLTLQRDVVKFFDFWGLERDLVSGASRGWFGPVGRPALLALGAVIVGAYVLALFSGLFGMFLTPPDLRVHVLFILLMAVVCGVHTLVFGHSRYHVPLMPLVLFYSASAVAAGPMIWQQRGRWPFWAAAGLCLMFVAAWGWLALATDLQRVGGLF